MICTTFDYLYRDASNFKAFGSVTLDRRINDAELAAIRGKLDGGEFFIAEQVGVPPLYEKLYQSSGGPTEADHCWHEFVALREGCQLGPADLSAGELVARFAEVRQWNQELSPHFSMMI